MPEFDLYGNVIRQPDWSGAGAEDFDGESLIDHLLSGEDDEEMADDDD